MERTTPKAAANALADSARAALQCITAVEVLTSGSDIGPTNSLILIPHTTTTNNYLLLHKPDRSQYLQLEVSVEYAVIFAPGSVERRPFRTLVTRYIYGIADLADRELFAFHWHPVGISDVRTPHLHVSVARSVSLPGRPGGPGLGELNLGKLHFPTHRIEVAELVRFLIVELGVGPRRPDWERVLDRL